MCSTDLSEAHGEREYGGVETEKERETETAYLLKLTCKMFFFFNLFMHKGFIV